MLMRAVHRVRVHTVTHATLLPGRTRPLFHLSPPAEGVRRRRSHTQTVVQVRLDVLVIVCGLVT